MRVKCFKLLILFLTLGYCLIASLVIAASPISTLQKAKQEAEARGYVFLTSHDEIVSMAKKEGKMNAVISSKPETVRAFREGFKSEYPFLDVSVMDTTGTEANERRLMELKAGRDTDTDSQHVPTDFFVDYLPFMKKYDILGMSEQGVLRISSKFVDPVNRNVIAIATFTQIVAYNKKLISGDKIPDTWEGFLKPEFKGKKFLLDIRATDIAALVPAWGLGRTIDFARKLAAQEPIWIRGGVQMLASMAAGEYGLFLGANLHNIKMIMAKDPNGNLAYKFVEPVQVRIGTCNGISYNAKHPHAALLFWEYVTSPKGQKILDEYEPAAASIFSQYAYVTEATKGKKISLVGWDQYDKIGGYQEKIVEAYGFPKAQESK